MTPMKGWPDGQGRGVEGLVLERESRPPGWTAEGAHRIRRALANDHDGARTFWARFGHGSLL